MKSPDPTLHRLLDLNGEIMEVGGGYWVAIRARIVPRSEQRPHGVDYSLCLYSPETGERVICYDNSHPVSQASVSSKTQSRINDHRHHHDAVMSYGYSDAETLMVDFWTEVDAFLRKKGAP